MNHKGSWALTFASLMAGILFAAVGIRLLVSWDWVSGSIYMIAGAGCLVYAYFGIRTEH